MKINHINIEVTKICNQSCFYCFNNSGTMSIGEILTPETWVEELKPLVMQGLKSVHLTGGEPFAYPYIIELINTCVDLGLSTSILSNGLKISLLVKKYPYTFKKLSLAQISLDSLIPEKQNQRRGYKNAFKDAITAIQSLSNIGVPLEISMTVDSENKSEINHIVDFAKKYVAKLIVRPLVSKGRAVSSSFTSITREELKTIQKAETKDIVKDRFLYVTEHSINHVCLLKEGVLTLRPDSTIESEYLNNQGIFKVNQLRAA